MTSPPFRMDRASREDCCDLGGCQAHFVGDVHPGFEMFCLQVGLETSAQEVSSRSLRLNCEKLEVDPRHSGRLIIALDTNDDHFVTVVLEVQCSRVDGDITQETSVAKIANDEHDQGDAAPPQPIPPLHGSMHRNRSALQNASSPRLGAFHLPWLYDVPETKNDELQPCNFVAALQGVQSTFHSDLLVEPCNSKHIPRQQQQQDVCFASGHLIVLVPGHSDWSSGLRSLRNQIRAVVPAAEVVVSKSMDKYGKPPHWLFDHVISQSCSGVDFQSLGVCLADEVSNHIDRLSQESEIRRLSFVACGTGGLIARAAVAWLHTHANIFHALITLSTPHLGLWPPSLSAPRRFLLWLARTKYPSKFLEQLALNDARSPQESFVYRLNHDRTFEAFKVVVIVEAGQDWASPVRVAENGVHSRADGLSRGESARKEAGLEPNGPAVQAPQSQPKFKVFSCRRIPREDVMVSMRTSVSEQLSDLDVVHVQFLSMLRLSQRGPWLPRLTRAPPLTDRLSFLRLFSYHYGFVFQ